MTMDTALFIGATSFACLLALMCLGLSFTYLTMRVPNFAHGDFVAIGGYVAYTAYLFTGERFHPVAFVPLSFLVTGLTSLAAYWFVLRHLSRRGVSLTDMAVVSLALEVMLRSVILIYADSMRSLTGRYFANVMVLDREVTLLGLKLPVTFVVSLLLTATILLCLTFLLTRTRVGINMRAAIDNPSLAASLGINVERCYALAWFIAGGITGVTGALLLSMFPLSPGVGWSLNVRIFAGSVLGGVNSLTGGVIGGIAVGYCEVFGIYALSRPPFNVPVVYRVLIPFTITIAVLLLAPRGLAGAYESLKYSLAKRR